MLGAFEVHRGDDRILARAWRTRQALAAVKMLLAERGRVVPAERLADLLWPDSDPAAGRHSLQVAIRTARTVLEPGLRSGAASRFIVTDGRGYRFSRDRCTVDADDLVAAHLAGRSAERAGDPRAAIDAYRAAVGLYRGAYLEEDESEEWALATREQLRETFIDSAQRLAILLGASGGSDEAAAAIERAIAADPLREDLYGALMRAHLAAGRRSHALAVYDRCARVLRAELGSTPGTALQLLRSRSHGASAALASERAPAEQAGVQELRLPFVGRAAELSRLADAWQRAQREGGVTALVEGAAGDGKTRLVRELSEAIVQRSRTLWLAGHESEQAMPFAPLRALVTAWLDRGAGATAVQRLGHHAGVLAPLLPGIRDLWPDAPAPEGQPDETAQAEAFTRAIALMKGSGSSLLVLDDLHWMDASTTRWLGYVLRRELAGLLIVATRRPAEGGTDPLDAVVGDLRRHERSITVRVGPLSRGDLEQLVATVTIAPTHAAVLAGRLHDSTGGNALFAVETLRELWHRGRAPDPDDLPIPATLRETIASRVARLRPATARALEAIAVLDAPASAEVIAATAALAPAECLGALEDLLRAQLARTSDDGQRYLAEHPLVRRATYGAMAPARRSELHLRAATVLGNAPLARLRHLDLGGTAAADLVHEAELAGGASLAAGRPADAAVCFERAHELLPSLPAGPGHRARVTERLAEALHASGRWRDAIALCRTEVARTADPLARSRLRRRAALALGDVEGRFAEALEMLDAAEHDLAGMGGPDAERELGLVAAARAQAHYYRSEYEQTIATGERAIAALDGVASSERDLVDVQERVAAAHQRLGHLEQTERIFRDAGARARMLGDALLEARVGDQLALALIHRGDLAEARDLLTSALAEYRTARAPKFEGRALVNLGWANTQLGAFATARDAYDEAIAHSEALGARYTVMHALVGIGQVLARLGAFGRARTDLERGVALAEEMGTRQRVAHGYAHLAELALLEGDAAAAGQLVARATAVADAIGDAHTIREGQVTLARALVLLGDPAAAAEAARRGIARSEESGFVLGEGRCRVALAEALTAAGDRATAHATLEDAITLFRRTGAAYDLALALAATVAATPGPVSRRALDEALTLARSCGARPLLKRLEAVTTSVR